MKSLETIRTIKPRDKTLLLDLKQVIRSVIPSANLLLYGSVARGTRGPESDYDILILTDSALSTQEEDAIRDAIYELELSHDVVISTIFYTKDQWNMPLTCVTPFHERVEREAVLL